MTRARRPSPTRSRVFRCGCGCGDRITVHAAGAGDVDIAIRRGRALLGGVFLRPRAVARLQNAIARARGR